MVGSIGLLAALAGSVLPQLMPGVPPLPSSLPKQESAAQDALHYTQPTWPEAPSSAAMLTRLGIGTGTVLVLCVATLWAGRRWLVGPVAPKTPAASQQLRLVEAVQLGSRCAVHLLQIGNRQVLVGVDATGMKAVVPLGDNFENTLDGLTDSTTGTHAADTTWRTLAARG